MAGSWGLAGRVWGGGRASGLSGPGCAHGIRLLHETGRSQEHAGDFVTCMAPGFVFRRGLRGMGMVALCPPSLFESKEGTEDGKEGTRPLHCALLRSSSRRRAQIERRRAPGRRHRHLHGTRLLGRGSGLVSRLWVVQGQGDHCASGILTPRYFSQINLMGYP